MNLAEILELTSVLLNLGFVILVAQEKVIAWPLGITGSILGVYLFASVDLNAEAALYSFYVIMGAYGWWSWNTKGLENEGSISQWNFSKHLILIVLGMIMGLSLGWVLQSFTSSAIPYIDSLTSVFGILATYLEAKKKLNSWVYWIVLNAISIWLYYQRGLNIYSLLMCLYFAMSIYGWISWRKRFKAQEA